MTSALDERIRLKVVRNGHPALPSIHKDVVETNRLPLRDWTRSLRAAISYFRLLCRRQVADGAKQSLTVLMQGPQPISSAESEIFFMAKPAYKCRNTYGLAINAMHANTSLRDTRADVNLKNSSLIHPKLKKQD